MNTANNNTSLPALCSKKKLTQTSTGIEGEVLKIMIKSKI